jgi:hypothetical protein
MNADESVETTVSDGPLKTDGSGVVGRVGETGTEAVDDTVERGSRPLLRTAGFVVLTFAAVGTGYGLAANFIIGFLIETFVEPGADPLANTLVGIVLVLSVVNTMLLGPVMAGISGLSAGRSFPDRGALARSLRFGVLSQYAPAEAAGAAESSGSGGPFTFSDLRPTLVEVGIPTGVGGAVTGYVGSWLAE